MMKSIYWADSYILKKSKPVKAIKTIKDGQRIFIGSACGEPQLLIRTLAEFTNCFLTG